MARVAWPARVTAVVRRSGPHRGHAPGPGRVNGAARLDRRSGPVRVAWRTGAERADSARQRHVGAVVVERQPGSPAYNPESGAMLVSITGPAGIAVDNALLHRQAQRLSVFDPLTGVGNLRMLTTTLAAEVERGKVLPTVLLPADPGHRPLPRHQQPAWTCGGGPGSGGRGGADHCERAISGSSRPVRR